MTKYVKAQVEKIEKPIALYTCLFFVGAFMIVYFSLISGMINNSFELRASSGKIDYLASKIADNESIYAKISSTIGEEFIREHNMVAISQKNTEYISVKRGLEVSFQSGF